MQLPRCLVGIALAMLGATSQADECFDLYQLSDYEHAVEPGIVVPGTEAVPRHCVVRGVINRAIRFEVRMPLDEWTGRFLMLGTGGASGYIADTRRTARRDHQPVGAENWLRNWVYHDPDHDLSTFDILADRGDLARASAIVDVNTADFAGFRERGGKVLMVQGWNDYPVRPTRVIDYLARAEAARTHEVLGLFMVPGMAHCGGGPGAHLFDM